MVYSLEFNLVSGSEAQKRAQQDFDDLQNEFAGRDIGRIARFLNGENDHPNSEKQRRRKEDAQLSRFMALMQSAEYARLYDEWGEKIGETRKFLDDARDQLTELRAKIEAERQDIDSRAARLSDGTFVYRGDDDRAYTRDGVLSDDPHTQHIQWRDDHARLSESQRNDDRATRAEQLEHKLDHADTAVGEMAERREDTANPITSSKAIENEMQSLDDMMDDISSGMSGLEESLSSKATPKGSGLEIPTSIPALQ